MKVEGGRSTVLDASALLALINQEPGAALVAESLPHACVSAVNFSEVAGKLIDKGLRRHEVDGHLASLDIEVIDFDRRAALAAAALRRDLPRTLSLGDRACLALGLTTGADVLTADRLWPAIGLKGVKITLIR